MNPDYKIEIATAPRCTSTNWRNKTMPWSALVERCATPKRTGETAAEYKRMNRNERSRVKDVGGFVGGYLAGGKRKTGCVLSRSLITLDLDHCEGVTAEAIWEEFTLSNDVAAICYSTHSHTPESPRLRLIILTDRPMTPGEYEPVSRYWTARIGIEMFDHTTYQVARLFYWPSASEDGEFFFRHQEGMPCKVDEILATYRDYRDASAWPTSTREGEVIAHDIKKAGDPLEKQGLIGAFCRAYTIQEVIDEMLADVYVPTSTPGRYTYKAGHVAGGLVTYEDRFAFSHHETDPAGGQLLNAFDLVRVHRFGLQDEGSRVENVTKRPSHLAMLDFAAKDARVRAQLHEDRLKAASTDFGGIDLHDGEVDDNELFKKLDVDRKGNALSTIKNIVTILEEAPYFKGRLYLDTLRNNIGIDGGLPWNKEARVWGNKDDANLRALLESAFNISGKDRIKDALDVVVSRHKRNPIKEYFDGLMWDGVERLDRLIIDYIGAEDCELNRAITRIHFTAAVARVMEPGCKYDYCLILAGPQGVGKSTLIAIMGGEYYKDGLTSMEGKEGAEQVRGAHLIEIGELDGMKRSEVSAVKQFITARVDEYRPAYAVHKEVIPRQCVFFGTTNEQYFLRDETGNRRFPVIKAQPELRRHGARWFGELERERDQLWAEAVHYYRQGLPIFLSDELEQQSRERQTEYVDSDAEELRGQLEAFLELKIPEGWEAKSLAMRRAYYRDADPLKADGQRRRDIVCPAEFICEFVGKETTAKDYRYLSRKVTKLLTDLGWSGPIVSRHAQEVYGRQKSYKRPDIDASDEDENL